MSRRYQRSGNSDEALTIPATDARQILGSFHTDPTGTTRPFWLTSLWLYNSSAATTALIQIYDQAEGVAVAANERLAFPVPTVSYVQIDFPDPGIKFLTDITAATTNGTIAIYQAGCSGYEEG